MPMKMMLKVTILKLNLKVGKVMHIQFGVGTAENPHVNFNFDLPTSLLSKPVQNIKVTIQDSEASIFY